MFQTLLAICFFFVPLSLSANEVEFPKYINLKKLPHDLKKECGLSAFNSAPEIAIFITYLKNLYQMDVAVETGTFKGNTSAFLSFIFDEVHTIEISEKNFLEAEAFLEKHPNIHCHLGGSETVLQELLPTLEDKRVLFYLDAHWNEFWPLLDEIRAIGKTHRDHCIIVIDDFKVPGRKDIPYDAYKGHACSYLYIKKALDEVFSDYSYHYILPRDIDSHAKFVVIPKNFNEKL